MEGEEGKTAYEYVQYKSIGWAHFFMFAVLNMVIWVHLGYIYGVVAKTHRYKNAPTKNAPVQKCTCKRCTPQKNAPAKNTPLKKPTYKKRTFAKTHPRKYPPTKNAPTLF